MGESIILALTILFFAKKRGTIIIPGDNTGLLIPYLGYLLYYGIKSGFNI